MHWEDSGERAAIQTRHPSGAIGTASEQAEDKLRLEDETKPTKAQILHIIMMLVSTQITAGLNGSNLWSFVTCPV